MNASAPNSKCCNAPIDFPTLAEGWHCSKCGKPIIERRIMGSTAHALEEQLREALRSAPKPVSSWQDAADFFAEYETWYTTVCQAALKAAEGE